ncbi:MAG: glycosyltransferase family 2 protein [Alphaproteobacteria bacterium]|nr:glycosyltransferase family 2 protein [Alphaproteobacteria bacterium]
MADRTLPKVLLAILAKQKAGHLQFFLRCIEALDYPPERIALYVRTNNNTDDTADILADWLATVGTRYAGVVFDRSDVAERVQDFAVHEWNAQRFSVLGRIRQESMQAALEHGCDFYFVADVDNFVRPHTLRRLVSLDLPIVAPFLKCTQLTSLYANYHEAVDGDGYLRSTDAYLWLFNQQVRGINEVALVHCTYLVRADAIPRLRYSDGSGRHEYVVFADSARRAGIAQYLDNRDIYGYVTFDEDSVAAERLVGVEVAAALALLGQTSAG